MKKYLYAYTRCIQREYVTSFVVEDGGSRSEGSLHTWNIVNLSFNFNYNLVIAEISFTLQFSNHPPNHPTAKVVETT